MKYANKKVREEELNQYKSRPGASAYDIDNERLAREYGSDTQRTLPAEGKTGASPGDRLNSSGMKHHD